MSNIGCNFKKIDLLSIWHSLLLIYFVSISLNFVTLPAPKVSNKSFSFTLFFKYSFISSKSLIWIALAPNFFISLIISSGDTLNSFVSLAANISVIIILSNDISDFANSL